MKTYFDQRSEESFNQAKNLLTSVNDLYKDVKEMNQGIEESAKLSENYGAHPNNKGKKGGIKTGDKIDITEDIQNYKMRVNIEEYFFHSLVVQILKKSFGLACSKKEEEKMNEEKG